MLKRIITLFLITIITFSFVLSNSTVFAYDEFLSGNDILFYNPSESGCLNDTQTNLNIKVSADIEERQKAVAEFLTTTNFASNNNKPMNSIQMAAVMGNIWQESTFRPEAVSGTGAYKGLIQWSDGRWANIADPKGFSEQLNHIKTEMDGAYKNSLPEFWSSSIPSDLEKATYAITRNYEVAVENGGGSTEWSNATDAENNVQHWAERIGYARASYDKYSGSVDSGYITGSDNCDGTLTTGGMDLTRANKLMDEYRALEPKDWPSGTTATPYDINGTNCSGGSLSNCVAFSQYFINRYTSIKYIYTSDGRKVVKDLLALGFKDGGHIPKVYAVFSKDGGSYGHTGIVLGIDKDKDIIVIGEAHCSSTLDTAVASEYKLSDFSKNTYTYAYTDGFLKGDL